MEQAKQFSAGREFIGGAMALALSNILCKFLGFLYKIPLANLIGSEGMGYFGFAYQIYGVVGVIAASGMPVALARLVAGRERRPEGSGGILTEALKLFAAVGVSGCATLLIFSKFLSALAGSAPSRYSVMALAPTAFFAAMIAAFRGYYQGKANMFPTALSQIIEAVLKLICGIGLAYWLYSRGMAAPIVAAGAIFGVTIGTAAGFAFLCAYTLKKNKGTPAGAIRRILHKERGIKRGIVFSALPATAGAFLFSLTSTIDAMLVMNRLARAGFDSAQATRLYGAYTGYAVTFYALPFALSSAVAASVLPLVASAQAMGPAGAARMKKSIGAALRITAIIAFPVGFFFLLMPRELMSLVFSRASDLDIATPLLARLSAATIITSLASVSTAMLQAMGKMGVSLISAASGGLLKLSLNYFLIGRSDINIGGAPIGTTACYGLILLVNLIVVFREARMAPPLAEFIFKPAICGALSAFAARGMLILTADILPGRAGTLLAIAAGAGVFALSVWLTDTLKGEDRALFSKILG